MAKQILEPEVPAEPKKPLAVTPPLGLVPPAAIAEQSSGMVPDAKQAPVVAPVQDVSPPVPVSSKGMGTQVPLQPTVPDTALWPQAPIPDGTEWRGMQRDGANNTQTLLNPATGGLVPLRNIDVDNTTVPSGGGLAVMGNQKPPRAEKTPIQPLSRDGLAVTGDQTLRLRGGNSVPQAENDRVIAQREQQYAPQKTLVGAGSSEPRLVGPGEEAFTPDFSRMSQDQVFNNLLGRKVAAKEQGMANIKSEMDARTAMMPYNQAGKAAEIGMHNATAQSTLGMIPYNQQNKIAETNMHDATSQSKLGMLPFDQQSKIAEATMHNATTQSLLGKLPGQIEGEKQKAELDRQHGLLFSTRAQEGPGKTAEIQNLEKYKELGATPAQLLSLALHGKDKPGAMVATIFGKLKAADNDSTPDADLMANATNIARSIAGDITARDNPDLPQPPVKRSVVPVTSYLNSIGMFETNTSALDNLVVKRWTKAEIQRGAKGTKAEKAAGSYSYPEDQPVAEEPAVAAPAVAAPRVTTPVVTTPVAVRPAQGLTPTTSTASGKTPGKIPQGYSAIENGRIVVKYK